MADGKEVDEAKAEEGLMNEGASAAKRKFDERKCVCGGKRGIILIVLIMLVVALSVGLGLGLRSSGQRQPLAIGAVAADHTACSQVGRYTHRRNTPAFQLWNDRPFQNFQLEILEWTINPELKCRDTLLAGGSAVDAAITTLLCDGVRQPHSMGIGGGCFMTIYQKTPRKVDVINGREFAPLAATIDKFINKSFVQGPLSIGVPAEVMAYWEAHQRYGKLPWKTLFEPAISMARDGHPLSHSSARALRILTSRFKVSLKSHFPELCKFFCDEQGGLKKAGDQVKMPALARTLSGIASHGPDYLYKGAVAEKLLQEIKGFGGLITKADFALNLTRQERPLEYQYGDLTMYVPTAPSGGPVMGLILEILEGFHLTPADIETPEAEAATYHKIIEAFKFAYADRLKLSDPLYVDIHDVLKKMTSPAYAALLREKIDLTRTHNASYYSDITGEPWDEHGTAQINVLAPNGDAVSVCSTINYYFGSLLVSPSTGIILNNEMADFSLPNVSYLDNLHRINDQSFQTFPNFPDYGKITIPNLSRVWKGGLSKSGKVWKGLERYGKVWKGCAFTGASAFTISLL